MTYRGKFFLAVVSAAIAFYAFAGVLIGFYGDISAQQPINDPGAQIRIFESVLQHIQNDYVDEPDLEKVRNGALRGLADGLDPYTSYLSAEQVRDYEANKDSSRVGIGAEFSQVSAYLYVVSVIKDSPADKAGLKAGDVIEYIDTKATRDISLYDARHLILGDAGTKVKLRVLRSGAKPQTLEVTRNAFKVPEATSEMKEGGIGLVKVYSLDKGKAKSVIDRISELKSKGVKKIILDLRNVGGGDIDEGVAVANAFIGKGDLAKVIGRENKVVKTYPADASKLVYDGKAVVLMDLGTAGAAEVVAAAFSDLKRGDVVGENSFGAGSEQQLFPLKGGDGFLLTTEKWASPNGKPFLASKKGESGVKPTVEVKRPETPESLEVEDLVDQQDEDGAQVPPAPEPEDTKPAAPAKPQEDLQLRKAIELLNGKAAAA